MYCSHSLTTFRSQPGGKKLSTIGDISYRTKWILSKRYMQAIIVITLMTLAIAVPLLTRAFALTDVRNPGVFQLDGTIHKTSSTTFPTNWDALFTSSGTGLPLPPGGLDSSFVNDAPLPDQTTFTTGSKDILDLPNSGWQCTSTNNVTPKDKILDVYSFAIVPGFGSRAGHIKYRSEEHTSELQSHLNLVCRLLLEKKKIPELFLLPT